MDKRNVVIIGDDEFQITAKGNQDAKYKAARKFRSKYHLNCPLHKIAFFATATKLPDPEFTTKRILAIIAEMEKVPA